MDKKTSKTRDFTVPVSTKRARTLALVILVLMALVGLSSVAVFCWTMFAPTSAAKFLLNAQVGLYSNRASSVSAPLMEAVLSRPFEAVFTSGYIRTIGMFVLALAIPSVVGLLNIYYLCYNATTKNPFQKSTWGYITTAGYAFAVEFLVSTVLFLVLKLIKPTIPFYITYATLSVAVLSLVVVLVLFTFRTLLDKMKELANEK